MAGFAQFKGGGWFSFVGLSLRFRLGGVNQVVIQELVASVDQIFGAGAADTHPDHSFAAGPQMMDQFCEITIAGDQHNMADIAMSIQGHVDGVDHHFDVGGVFAAFAGGMHQIDPQPEQFTLVGTKA